MTSASMCQQSQTLANKTTEEETKKEKGAKAATCYGAQGYKSGRGGIQQPLEA